jgi:2-polyprenyl-3-methyl-5-hydroxy-6-metoxy-1,4-benzoquinol methylase
MSSSYVQQNQPPGVPPLALTGERTLPDVPEENYWYRRHVAAYRWVAERCGGQRVVDLACGEGYGSAILAEHAQRVLGVDANPEAHQHARLKYRKDNLSFRRALVEQFDEHAPYDAIVFLQTIEHVQDPGALLERLALLLVPGGVAYVSTPNRLTLAPPGAIRSDNPWHVREYDAGEYRELVERYFRSVELLGLHHAGKLRLHQHAVRLGWDRLHRALRLTNRFYRWFVPAISEKDFAVRAGDLEDALDFLAVCRR